MQTLDSKSLCKPIGRVRLVRFDREGTVKDVREADNLIVSVGKALLSSRLIADTDSAAAYLAIGTGSASAAAGNTALGSEHSRASATVTQETTVVTDDTAQFEYTFSFTGTYSIAEAGVFNAATGGTLLSRRVFSNAVSCVDGDSLLVTWGFQF